MSPVADTFSGMVALPSDSEKPLQYYDSKQSIESFLSILGHLMLNTVKILNIWTPKIITVTVLKMEKFGLLLKDEDELANSADPDKTAPEGAVLYGSAQFAQTYLSQYKDFLPKTL